VVVGLALKSGYKDQNSVASFYIFLDGKPRDLEEIGEDQSEPEVKIRSKENNNETVTLQKAIQYLLSDPKVNRKSTHINTDYVM
jgi:hypothetical protein